MLVLTRRPGQSLRVGPNIEVRIVRVESDRVVVAIAAPRHVAVVRSELIEEVSEEIREAADTRAKLRVMLAPTRSPKRSAGDGPAPEDPGVA